jgi:hypothetical protein
MYYFDLLQSWINTPYVHQGYSRSGVDCVGLLRAVGQECGVDYSPWDIPDRPFTPRPRLLLQGLAGSHIPAESRTPGILTVALLPDCSGLRHHLGLMVVHDQCLWALHACRESNKVKLSPVLAPPTRHWYHARSEHLEQSGALGIHV